jgi:hypothetical protein
VAATYYLVFTGTRNRRPLRRSGQEVSKLIQEALVGGVVPSATRGGWEVSRRYCCFEDGSKSTSRQRGWMDGCAGSAGPPRSRRSPGDTRRRIWWSRDTRRKLERELKRRGGGGGGEAGGGEAPPGDYCMQLLKLKARYSNA